MNLQIESPAIRIHPGQPLRLRAGAGRHITNVSGTAWLTVDGEPDDIILEPGDSHAFAHPSRILVQALGGDVQLVTEEGVGPDHGNALAAAWRSLWKGLAGTDTARMG